MFKPYEFNPETSKKFRDSLVESARRMAAQSLGLHESCVKHVNNGGENPRLVVEVAMPYLRDQLIRKIHREYGRENMQGEIILDQWIHVWAAPEDNAAEAIKKLVKHLEDKLRLTTASNKDEALYGDFTIDGERGILFLRRSHLEDAETAIQNGLFKASHGEILPHDFKAAASERARRPQTPADLARPAVPPGSSFPDNLVKIVWQTPQTTAPAQDEKRAEFTFDLKDNNQLAPQHFHENVDMLFGVTKEIAMETDYKDGRGTGVKISCASPEKLDATVKEIEKQMGTIAEDGKLVFRWCPFQLARPEEYLNDDKWVQKAQWLTEKQEIKTGRFRIRGDEIYYSFSGDMQKVETAVRDGELAGYVAPVVTTIEDWNKAKARLAARKMEAETVPSPSPRTDSTAPGF